MEKYHGGVYGCVDLGVDIIVNSWVIGMEYDWL